MSSLITSFQHYLPAVGIILLPNIGGLLSGMISRDRVWYKSLKRPALSPPSWLFPPVWTSIYACMGVSSYLIFKEGGLAAQAVPLSVFGAQLLLNWIWTPTFFRFHRLDLVTEFLASCRMLGIQFIRVLPIHFICWH